MATSRSGANGFSKRLNRRLAGGRFAVYRDDRASRCRSMVGRQSCCENRGLSPVIAQLLQLLQLLCPVIVVGARRRTGGNRRNADRAVCQRHPDPDGGKAPRIENFEGVDGFNAAVHVGLPFDDLRMCKMQVTKMPENRTMRYDPSKECKRNRRRFIMRLRVDFCCRPNVCAPHQLQSARSGRKSRRHER